MFKPDSSSSQLQHILQYISRHCATLKQVAQSCQSEHPEITKSRIEQCTHLLSKKMSFHLTDNVEEYYDYLQDFYDTQIEGMRKENSNLKFKINDKDQSIKELIAENQMLKGGWINNHEEFDQVMEQNVALKKEMGHLKSLLTQNNLLIEEQNCTINQFTKKIYEKQQKLILCKKQYEAKVLKFDAIVRENQQRFERNRNSLDSESKDIAQQMKQLSLTTLKAIEQKEILEKDYYCKLEEVKLLTKKIYESDLVISKLERQVTVKEVFIQQLSEEVSKYERQRENTYSKEQKLKKEYFEKKVELDSCSFHAKKLQGKIEQLEETIKTISREKDTTVDKMKKLKDQYEETVDKIQRLEREKLDSDDRQVRGLGQLNKLRNEVEKSRKQVKLAEERYSHACQNHNLEKAKMKNDVMMEVQELAQLNKKQCRQINILNQALIEERKKNEILEKKNQELQGNFFRMNYVIEEVNADIRKLEKEKTELQHIKTALEQERQKERKQVSQFYELKKEISILLIERKQWLKNKSEYENSISELARKLELNRQKKSEENHNLEQQCQYLKKQIERKDFQIQQLDNKIKMLKESLRNSNTLYENQKIKMNVKILQLQQLLRDRYQLSQPASSK